MIPVQLYSGFLRSRAALRSLSWRGIEPWRLRQPIEEAFPRLRAVEIDEILEPLTSNPDPLHTVLRSLLQRVKEAKNGGTEAEAQRLIRSLVPLEFAASSSKIPWHLEIASECFRVLPSLATGRYSSFCDSHLHSGGVSPPTVVLDGLLRHWAGVLSWPAETKLLDGDGRDLPLPAIVAGLGISALLLNRDPSAGSAALRQVAGSGWTVENLWTRVLHIETAEDPGLAQLQRALPRLIDLAGEWPDLSVVLREGRSWIDAPAVVATSSGLVRGAVAALCLFHGALSMPFHGGSLDSFVDRFDALRKVRKISAEMEETRIFRSVSHILSTGMLARFELRKTSKVGMLEGKLIDAYADIVEDLDRHVKGVTRSYEVIGSGVLPFQVPICFLRSAPDESLIGSVEFDEARLHVPLNSALCLAQGILRACKRSSATQALIGGVDVVGNESLVPNWMYAVVFDYLRTGLVVREGGSFTYSVHAGEQFAFPLDGLRRVGELSFFSVSVTRVGHALSLSAATALHASSAAGPLNAFDCLQSLAWACISMPEVAADCTAMGEKIARTVFGNPVSWPNFTQAYRSLFDADTYRSLGLAPAASGFENEILDYRDCVRVRSATNYDDVTLLAYLSVVDVTKSGLRCNRRVALPAFMEGEFRELSDQLYERCLPGVRNWFDDERIVESCPTSNFMLGGLPSFASLPVLDFVKTGVPFTISTDDPGLLGTVIEDEYIALHTSGCVSDSEALSRAMELSRRHSAPGMTVELATKYLRSITREA